VTSPSWGSVTTASPANFIDRILHIAGATLAFSNNRLSICYLLSAFTPFVSLVVQLAVSPEFNQSGAAWEHSCHVIPKSVKQPF